MPSLPNRIAKNPLTRSRCKGTGEPLFNRHTQPTPEVTPELMAPLVLAMGPNSRVGSGYGSTRNRTVATDLTTRKTWTIWNGPLLPPKTRHFKFTILAPIKYLSSDRIMTWSVCRLSSFGRSFTSRSQICDQTNICWVVIENLPIWCKISRYFTGTQRILVRSQIWEREVKEQLILHNLHTDHVMIQSGLKYLIGAKVGGSATWNRGPGTTRPKNCGFRSGLGNKPAKTKRVRFLAGFGTEPNWTAGQNPDRWRVTWTHC